MAVTNAGAPPAASSQGSTVLAAVMESPTFCRPLAITNRRAASSTSAFAGAASFFGNPGAVDVRGSRERSGCLEDVVVFDQRGDEVLTKSHQDRLQLPTKRRGAAGCCSGRSHCGYARKNRQSLGLNPWALASSSSTKAASFTTFKATATLRNSLQKKRKPHGEDRQPLKKRPPMREAGGESLPRDAGRRVRKHKPRLSVKVEPRLNVKVKPRRSMDFKPNSW